MPPSPTSAKIPLRALLLVLAVVILDIALLGFLQSSKLFPFATVTTDASAHSSQSNRSSTESAKWFSGIQRVEAAEICSLLPAHANRPQVLAFSSQYCHDCQKLKPILEKALQTFPQIQMKRLDVMADRKAATPIFTAFQPKVVPVLVMIRPDCGIQNVLYGYQSPNALRQAFSELMQTRRN